MPIRLATADDAEAIRRIYAPYVEDTPISFEETPPTAGEMRDRVEETLPAYPWLVYEADGDPVGYAHGGDLREYEAYRWAVESSVYVAASARGEGIGGALYESLLALLERQGYVEVHALVTLPNPASVALHESFGFERRTEFERLGFKDGWQDVAWFSLPLREHPDDPEPPRPVSDLRGSDAWNAALEAGEKRIDG